MIPTTWSARWSAAPWVAWSAINLVTERAEVRQPQPDRLAVRWQAIPSRIVLIAGITGRNATPFGLAVMPAAVDYAIVGVITGTIIGRPIEPSPNRKPAVEGLMRCSISRLRRIRGHGFPDQIDCVADGAR